MFFGTLAAVRPIVKAALQALSALARENLPSARMRSRMRRPVERTTCWLKDLRRVRMRFDRLAVTVYAWPDADNGRHRLPHSGSGCRVIYRGLIRSCRISPRSTGEETPSVTESRP